MKRFLFLTICIFALSLASQADAQSLPVKAGFLDRCESQADCEGGLTCPLDRCVECARSSECPAGETCQFGACVKSGGNLQGDRCSFDDQCSTISLLCDDDSYTCVSKANLNNEGVNPPSRRPAPDSSSEFPTTGDGYPGVDLTVDDIEDAIIATACWITRIAGIFTVIAVVLVGIAYMFSGFNEKWYTTAKTAFKRVLIGTLVIYGVYVILSTIASLVTRSEFFIPAIC